MADKYLSAAGKRRRLYINTIKAWSELMANICRQKTSSDYSCHPNKKGAQNENLIHAFKSRNDRVVGDFGVDQPRYAAVDNLHDE